MNDIIVNKIQTIQRCVERAREEYQKNPAGFDTDYTIQDAAVLNIVRACEQAIDLANHIIKSHKMGIPTSSNESFDLLQKKHVIDRSLAGKLKNMVGFRNTVIHEYKRIDIEIVKSVIVSDLDDLLMFGDRIMEFVDGALT
jgi:uncharacterized protein YutE (UPF0331/DUF86 family)